MFFHEQKILVVETLAKEITVFAGANQILPDPTSKPRVNSEDEKVVELG